MVNLEALTAWVKMEKFNRLAREAGEYMDTELSDEAYRDAVDYYEQMCDIADDLADECGRWEKFNPDVKRLYAALRAEQ